MEPEYLTFEEQVFFSTVRIERPATNTMGTGFTVEVPAGIPGRKYIFLVTNRHVLDDPKKETRLTFHLEESGKPKLGEACTVNVTEVTRGYYCPDDDTDLALLNVSDIAGLVEEKKGKKVFLRSLTPEYFSDYSDTDLRPNKRVAFIGYPSDRFDKKNYLPILRSGVIASIPKVDFEGMPQILVDAQVFQGSSGSPVFATLGNQWKCIGVIFQTMIRNQQVQIIETAQQSYSQEVLGIGLVIKSTKVLELIHKAKTDLDKINSEDAGKEATAPENGKS